MQALIKKNFTRYFLLLILLFLCISQTKSQSFHDITEVVPGYDDYKKAEFSQDSSDVYYFKYSISQMPQSRIMAFRFVFDEFDTTFKDSKILCTSVDASASDDTLKTQLDGLDATTSSCIGDFNEQEDQGMYDGIIKLDTTKTKLGIKLQVSTVTKFNARIFLKVVGTSLETMLLKFYFIL